MGEQGFAGPLERIDDTTWKIPRSYKPGMRVDGLIFANEELLDQSAQRPGTGAGGQCGLSPGHSAG